MAISEEELEDVYDSLGVYGRRCYLYNEDRYPHRFKAYDDPEELEAVLRAKNDEVFERGYDYGMRWKGSEEGRAELAGKDILEATRLLDREMHRGREIYAAGICDVPLPEPKAKQA